jgi:hypothetical protein
VGLGIWEMGCAVAGRLFGNFCPILPNLKIGPYFSI